MRGPRSAARDERANNEKGHAQNGAASQGHRRVLTKISNQTGVPVRRLTRQKAKTGLGFGTLEKANLLAKATGRSFRRVVSRFRSGEGFGKIAPRRWSQSGQAREPRPSIGQSSAKCAQNPSSERSGQERNCSRQERSCAGNNRLQRASAAAHGKSAVAHGNNSLQRPSAVAHGASAVARGNNSFQRASAF